LTADPRLLLEDSSSAPDRRAPRANMPAGHVPNTRRARLWVAQADPEDQADVQDLERARDSAGLRGLALVDLVRDLVELRHRPKRAARSARHRGAVHVDSNSIPRQKRGR
jgi:hypothetical protein